MEEKDIVCEAMLELRKGSMELAKDVIREANRPGEPTDLIKHVLKRMALHQVILDRRSRGITWLLVVLSVFMAVGAVAQVLSFILGR